MQEPIIVNSKPLRPPRRSYTKQFKIDLVAQCERGDRSLAQIAMDHKINANQLRRWQRELNGDFGPTKMVPVKIEPVVSEPEPAAYIQININAVTLKVVGGVDSRYIAELIRSLR